LRDGVFCTDQQPDEVIPRLPETTEDGASAFAVLAAEIFDLVLLDLMMPGMSGFEVLCRIESR
jgi:CheY-like chemotaxis protein